ncbi:MAG: hypothetical protein ACP5MD_06670 [Verrucomicrobiia bacterium]
MATEISGLTLDTLRGFEGAAMRVHEEDGQHLQKLACCRGVNDKASPERCIRAVALVESA